MATSQRPVSRSLSRTASEVGAREAGGGTEAQPPSDKKSDKRSVDLHARHRDMAAHAITVPARRVATPATRANRTTRLSRGLIEVELGAAADLPEASEELRSPFDAQGPADQARDVRAHAEGGEL